ncbi:hypothetical protein F4805DRAFT_476581 [Annulohypoxylon moriforme]|nr:hypothetical protein F4805DRAFT_476581 [Annulohypoxylon moriforme]
MNAQHLDAASGAYMLGSALLKADKLPQAEWAFSEGRRFAEHDYRFPAKIAAIRYEMGNYTSAVFFIERALSLLDSQSQDATRQELYLSMARACILSGKLEKARVTIPRITSESDRCSLQQSLLHMDAMTSIYPDKDTLWREVTGRLPRCRSRLANDVEYFPVGGDQLRGLSYHTLIGLNQEDLSFLSTKTGDARDVFATLCDLGSEFSTNSFSTIKKFYFTLVDTKPVAFARNLLMFRMLTDWVTESETEQRVTMATLVYTFASQIMPSWIYDRLKSAMRSVVDELCTNVPLVMGRFCMDATTRDSIASHLRNWQDPLQHPFTTKQILNITHDQLSDPKRTQIDMEAIAHPELHPELCEPDKPDSLCFRDLNFMLPPISLLAENERGLLDLARRFGYMPSCPFVGKILLGEYYSSKDDHIAPPRMNFTPQEVARDIYSYQEVIKVEKADPGAFDYLAFFFTEVAKWSEKIREQTMVKIIVDDAMNVMELARLHLLNHDHPSIPDRYDMIDMSYLPGFIGGPLTTFTYGIPILRHDKTSELQSFVALNSEVWTTHDQFLTEHLLLTDRSTVTNTFAATLTQHSSKLEARLSNKISGFMQEPFSWTRTNNKHIRSDQSMPRNELVKWLHMHFLKLCLPPHRASERRRQVYMPLNMTAFFRLIIHLSGVGYPSHWLSAILMEICSGRISTQARAPKEMIMSKAEVMHKHPWREIPIEPFVEEFRTQFTIWRHLLPFGVLQDESLTQHINLVREYKQRFPSPFGTLFTSVYHPVNVLVFWNVSMNGEIPQTSLRQILLDDENTDPKYQGISSQAGRVHIISTVSVAWSSMAASFWFADGLIQNILSTGSHWEAWLWDTNAWMPKLGPARVNQMTLRAGDTWCESDEN